MANPYFRFKQFAIAHDRCAMKVTTDACLFGAWVAQQLAGKEGLALDIGTGTGLLSLMLAQKAPLRIDAVELDEQAAKQAAENRDSAGFEQVRIIKGDIRTLDLPHYDYIISNPPFYEREIESADARKRSAHHSDGLSWAELFPILYRQLKPGGTVFLLLPAKRRKELSAFVQLHRFFIREIVEVRPSPRQEASRLLVSLQKTETQATHADLLIAHEQGYSERFTELLRDYYLYL